MDGRLASKTLLCLLLLCNASLAHAQNAAALQTRNIALQKQLSNNQFNKPLYLESSEQPDALQGDIYARIDQSFAVVGPALLSAKNWCDILILHLNVKDCRVNQLSGGDTISVTVGRKFDQPLADGYLFEFNFSAAKLGTSYQQVTLSAPKGPLGTSDYRIVLELAGLDATHSFLHMSYAYRYGAITRFAMQSYLATGGRNKIGFTRVGSQSNSQPVYIGGQRGVVERNTMRYYLAIVAYLDTLATPASQQLNQRLNDWYASIEEYPAQLHELNRQQYLDMKHREILRQQIAR
ncbi:MAG: hypothetical protein AB7F79_06910 [Steroidobacteraceae bacterium]